MKRLIFAVAILLTVLSQGCKNDSDMKVPDDGPEIKESGMEPTKKMNYGDSIHFVPNVELAGEKATYLWTINSKEVSKEPSYWYKADDLCIDTLRFTATTASGSAQEQSIITVVGQKPTVFIEGLDKNETLPIGDSLVLKSQVESALDVTYQWFLDDKMVSQDTNYTYHGIELGSQVLRLEVVNKVGAANIRSTILVQGPFRQGAFIVNEGWFGHESGNINYYSSGSDKIQEHVFAKNNPQYDPMNALGVTTCYGTIYHDKAYIVSKQGTGNRLVIANAETMKEIKRGDWGGSYNDDGRAIVNVSDEKGYISTASGVKAINFTTFKTSENIEGISGETGVMVYTQGKVFAQQSKYLHMIDATTDKHILTIDASDSDSNGGGVVVGKDHKVYAAFGKNIYKIEPNSGKVLDIIKVKQAVRSTFNGAWIAGSLSASHQQNALFYITGDYRGGDQIYRYDIDAGVLTPLGKSFFSQDLWLYGRGISVDPKTDQIYATSVEQGYGDHYSKNILWILDGRSGNVVKKIAYDYYYFPSMALFNTAI